MVTHPCSNKLSYHGEAKLSVVNKQNLFYFYLQLGRSCCILGIEYSLCVLDNFEKFTSSIVYQPIKVV